MIPLYTLIIIGLCFLIFYNSRLIWTINQARRKGLYPQEDRATLFDVRRLIVEGKRDLAVKLYRKIYNVNQHDAKHAVDELQKSVIEKNSGLE